MGGFFFTVCWFYDNIVLPTKGEDGWGGIYRDSCYRHDADTSEVIYLDLYEDWEGRGFKYRWLH